jgi:putative endopeptidase
MKSSFQQYRSPYFDNEADDALNYGGIGMVIGHEITHTLTTKAHNMTEGNVKTGGQRRLHEEIKNTTSHR